jgi:hypothetical protein
MNKHWGIVVSLPCGGLFRISFSLRAVIVFLKFLLSRSAIFVKTLTIILLRRKETTSILAIGNYMLFGAYGVVSPHRRHGAIVSLLEKSGRKP